MKILLADDEMSIVKMVRQIVNDCGYEFVYALNGKDAVELFMKEKPDLLILDIMMPLLDGFDVCNIIRQESDVPIIFLSAKSNIMDKSMAFKMGSDDYMSKPFSSLELELRIKALLRRTHKNIDKKAEEHIYRYKDIEINHETMELTVRGEKVNLTIKEFAIISLLAKNPGQVFTKNQLLDNIWGPHHVGDFNSLTVFIRRIREKIELNPAEPEYILTAWGVGYKFSN